MTTAHPLDDALTEAESYLAQAKARQRLERAAPAMLDALQAIIDAPGHAAAYGERWTEQARAAIKLATEG